MSIERFNFIIRALLILKIIQILDFVPEKYDCQKGPWNQMSLETRKSNVFLDEKMFRTVKRCSAISSRISLYQLEMQSIRDNSRSSFVFSLRKGHMHMTMFNEILSYVSHYINTSVSENRLFSQMDIECQVIIIQWCSYFPVIGGHFNQAVDRHLVKEHDYLLFDPIEKKV